MSGAESPTESGFTPDEEPERNHAATSKATIETTAITALGQSNRPRFGAEVGCASFVRSAGTRFRLRLEHDDGIDGRGVDVGQA